MIILFFGFSNEVKGQTVVWEEGFPESNNTKTDPDGRWNLDPSNDNSFSIRSHELRANNINGLWSSESIDISGYPYISISVDIRAEGPMENADYIELEYNVDGTGWNTFETNGYIQNNFGSEVAMQNNFSGNSLLLRIRMVNSANNEYYYADNIVVTGSNYCFANSLNEDEYIDRVQIGTIDNNISGSGYSAGGYGDFTGLSTDLYQGQTNVSLTLTYGIVGYGSGYYYTGDDIGVWIDWNQDGDFNDANENVICHIGITTTTFSFSVPGTATPGPTRMRIRLKYDDADCGSPCGTTSYGEVEDYTINVLSLCTQPDIPTLSATSSIICSGGSTTLSIASGSLNDADYWQWYSASCGGTAIGQGSSVTVSPSATTTYYARGEGSCDGLSCGSITITVNEAIPDFAGTVTNATCPDVDDGAIELDTSLDPYLDFQNADFDYVNINDNFLSNLSEFTLEGWIRVDKTNIGNRIGLFGQNDAIEFGFIDNTNIQCWTPNGGSVNVALSQYPNDNDWHHLAAVGTGNEIIVYIDGVTAGTGGSSTSDYGASSDVVRIGAAVFDPTSNTNTGFTGQIATVGFWNTALNSTQIGNLALGFVDYSGTEAGLIAGYNISEGSGSSISSEPAGNDGSFVNSPEWDNVYSFVWTKTDDISFSSTSKNLSNISSGEYNVVVSDGVCSSNESFIVGADNPSPVVTFDSEQSVCSGDVSASFSYSFSSGDPVSYSIDWNDEANTAGLLDQGITNYTFIASGGDVSGVQITSGIPSGEYIGDITVNNAAGCDDVYEISISVIEPQVVIDKTVQEKCPDLVDSLGFNPNNSDYNAGATAVIFTIERNQPVNSEWSFSYELSLTGTDIVPPLRSDSPNDLIGTSGLISDATDSVELVFYIFNNPGNTINAILELDAVIAGGCPEESELNENHIFDFTVLPMPEVGRFE